MMEVVLSKLLPVRQQSEKDEEKFMFGKKSIISWVLIDQIQSYNNLQNEKVPTL